MSGTTYGVGDQNILGYADEGGTPGTAAAVAHYLAPEPGTDPAQFDPGRQDVEVMSGNPETVVGWIDTTGKMPYAFTSRVFQTYTGGWETEVGLTNAGVVASGSFTLTQSLGPTAYQYPGCRNEKIVLTSNPQGGLRYAFSGRGTARPIPVAALGKPALDVGKAFDHSRLTALTLLSGASDIANVNEIMLTADTMHAGGQGGGTPLENILRHATTKISFSLKLWLNDVNVAEYNDMIQAGGVDAALTMVWTLGGNSITLAVPKANYKNGPIKAPKGGLVFVTLTGSARRTDNSTAIMTWNRV